MRGSSFQFRGPGSSVALGSPTTAKLTDGAVLPTTAVPNPPVIADSPHRTGVNRQSWAARGVPTVQESLDIGRKAGPHWELKGPER